MLDIYFTKTKFGSKLTKNKLPIKLDLKNCKCIQKIHQEHPKGAWHMTIEVPDDVSNILKEIDASCISYCENKSFLNSIHDNKMKVKIPYRYRKFECEFFDSKQNRIISSDIVEGTIISLKVDCTNLWDIENGLGKLCGLTWQTKSITLH